MLRRSVLASLACCCALPAYALYDPQPDAALAAVEGEWMGTLVYRDYRRPDRMVTLPTRLFVALAAPDTLTLHYVFDDGPGKTVYSYERMRFDVANGAVGWITGDEDRTASEYRIVSIGRDAGTTRMIFEGPAKGDAGGGKVRFTMELGAQRLMLKKEEVDAGGESLLRNAFTFGRAAR